LVFDPAGFCISALLFPAPIRPVKVSNRRNPHHFAGLLPFPVPRHSVLTDYLYLVRAIETRPSLLLHRFLSSLSVFGTEAQQRTTPARRWSANFFLAHTTAAPLRCAADPRFLAEIEIQNRRNPLPAPAPHLCSQDTNTPP
jgi:hypothetical protein